MEHYVEIEAQGEIALLRLNRPERLNAISPGMMIALADALEEVGRRKDIRAVVLTGAGRSFCAGADLKHLDESGLPGHDQIRAHFDAAYNRAVRAMLGLGKPLVTALNGVVAGGGVGLALTADVVIAAEDASFHLVFAPKLGIAPDCGASWLMPRLLGRNRAMALIMTGQPFSATAARDWGLVWEVAPQEALLARALETARALADGSTETLVLIRDLVDGAADRTLDGQLDAERDLNAVLVASAVFDEGVCAFRERRSPEFRGLSTEAIR